MLRKEAERHGRPQRHGPTCKGCSVWLRWTVMNGTRAPSGRASVNSLDSAMNIGVEFCQNEPNFEAEDVHSSQAGALQHLAAAVGR